MAYLLSHSPRTSPPKPTKPLNPSTLLPPLDQNQGHWDHPRKPVTATPSDEPPSVNFAFVNSVLLPDGTPDVHFRSACGGQKLRDIMLDSNIDLYGPYARPLLNCGGGEPVGLALWRLLKGRSSSPHGQTRRRKNSKGTQKLGDLPVKPQWARQTQEPGGDPATSRMESP
ncbi:Photosynthetic NDH subunit of subcomplex B 3, chloroplastic [Vitis vinifera]|uniref:Photosynthetic NDH subunit of subcomplex B 3, chloroplastic n=1 Tax=Vitis vinifera TaxID=29760 RepID=A0A438GBA6_VITVI|nr:Photosynthetic NDH subunit of subcomplex B 3, chloroplastic [Vitis vinifera]